MRAGRWLRQWGAAALLGTVLAAAPAAAGGQAPPPSPVPRAEPPWAGIAPAAGGVGLLVMRRAEGAASVATRLEREGCPPASVASTSGGRWMAYVPGARDFANAGFPSTLDAGQPFAVRCLALHEPIALDERDAGRTVHAGIHQRLRLSLPANPSTGHAWRFDPPAPASVIEQVGEPEFAGPALPGAAGTTTFELLASGPGLVELRLVYDRASEPNSTLREWSVTVAVRGQQAVAWLGEVRTQPQAAAGARYLELRVPLLDEGAVPPGAGLQASDGATANLIEALVDTGTDVLVWGELTCGVADYGGCRIDATTIAPAAGSGSLPTSPVVGWQGTVRAIEDEDLFELEGTYAVQYGVRGATAEVEDLLRAVRTDGRRIRVWGDLEARAGDVNHTRIVVTHIALAP